MRLLLVEDDHLLGKTIQKALTSEGYFVDWVLSGDQLTNILQEGHFDLLILDNRLPGVSGISLLKSIRKLNIELPVLMLTACDSLDDKVNGFNAGADDYLTKPFEMDELFVRIRSLIRRSVNNVLSLRVGDLEIDPIKHQVSNQGEIIDNLTAKEFSILELLVRNRGCFITKHRLFESCANWNEEICSNTIEVYISRLRKKFGSDLIETLRGVGYRIK